MFDIGGGELVVIGVVALIAIGPKELPGVLRTVGQAMGKVRRMAAEFQGQFHEAMREAEMADIKKTVEETTTTFTNYDPLADTQKEIEKSFEDKPALPAPETVASTPDVKIDIPLPEPLPPVTSADFITADPVSAPAVAPKKAAKKTPAKAAAGKTAKSKKAPAKVAKKTSKKSGSAA